MMTTNGKKLDSVLLIDDNEIDNFVNRKILENSGVSDIHTFECPSKALQYLEQTTDIPQLILLDINFPIMNGFEFIDEFRKLEIAKHQIDIFILSASANPADIKKAKQKCSGFIEKFLTKEKLAAQLNSLVPL
ncbi:MAG: response regulator [Bacteroidetes bacterium]|nr:response regulator [Bacteroidota bacterium]